MLPGILDFSGSHRFSCAYHYADRLIPLADEVLSRNESGMLHGTRPELNQYGFYVLVVQ